MSPSEWRRVGAMTALIAGLHVVGFGLLIFVVAPAKYKLGAAGTFAIGTGVTAYTLGLRHAFDADHIAAIDNTTRKFMSEGKRPLSVGFFFSLGHSMIGVVRIFFNMRRGAYDEQELEQQLNSRGLMNRFFGRHLNKITKPQQMYPVGMLFGLGFDTATEVALLILAAGAGAAGLPWYAILCLPVLFAAGMSLLDTIDGSFMNFAYGWAFSKPVRKVYYNITITGLSIAIALFIGTIELVGLLLQKLSINGSVSDWFQHFNINRAGFIIVAMFVGTWTIAVAIWRFARIEERWSAGMELARLRSGGGTEA
jgi:high-affinity nickel-transport protein